VLHFFGQMNRGGAEIRTKDLMEPLKKDIEFHFLSLSGLKGPLDDEIIQLGGKIHHIPLNMFFIFELYKLNRKESFDIAHSHVSLVSGAIVFLCFLLGIQKRICHFRNTDDSSKESFLRKTRNGLLKLLIKVFSTNILAVGESSFNIRWSENWRKDKRCKVIYNGFPLKKEKLSKGYWKEIIPNYDGSDVLIHVGRFDHQKNHVRLLEIFNELLKNKLSYLILVGKVKEPINKQVQDYINYHSLEDRVYILGEQSNVYPLLANSNLLLFPSLWEGIPGVVVESIMMGTRVVGSNIPSISELSKKCDGIHLSDLNNSNSDWAVMVHHLLQKSYDRDVLINSFINSDFSIEKCTKSYLEIYES
jgi:glycosyltransferase involved in cell wall biosynthesis